MLKLRAPIKTCFRKDMLASQENFCERIRGNYTQMGSELTEADLLHLTTQPPEIFVMGGAAGSMVSNSNIENTQIQKVNVINNLINRILISADAKLSYQDVVYISNVLHKLGIKDERKFMKEVRRLTSETKQLNDITQLYWDNVEELRNMVSEYAQDMRLEFKSENEVINNSILHLHETVNRRLKTAAIYQIMRNYYENNEDSRSISNSEYRISEQGRFAKEVLLNRLRETVRMETQPLVYKHENIYEGDETEINSMSVEQINERVSSAVLMNLIDNIYELSYERVDHHVRNWLSTEDSYYGASDNVLYRLEQNTAYLQYLHEEYVRNLEHNDNYRTEIESVRQMLELHRNIDNSIKMGDEGDLFDLSRIENRLYDSTYTQNSESESFISADMTFVQNEGNTEQRLYRDERYREGDIYNTDSTRISNENINITGRGSQAQGQAEAAPGYEAVGLTHISNEEYREGDTDINVRTDVRNEGDNILYDNSVRREESNINLQQLNIAQGAQPQRTENVQPVELTHISNEEYREGDTNIDTRTDIRREGDNVLYDSSVMREESNINLQQLNIAQGAQPQGTDNVQPVELTHISTEERRDGDTNIDARTDIRREGDNVLYACSGRGGEGSINLQQPNIAQVAQPQGTDNVQPVELTHISTEERREGDTNIDARTDIRREGDNVLYDSSIRREESNINLQQLNIAQGTQPQGTENIEPVELTHISTEERREGDTDIDARTDIRREGDNVLYDSSVRREESNINLQQINITRGTQPQGTDNVQPVELTHIRNEEYREGDTNIDARTDVRREGDNVLYDSSVRREESSINLQQLNIAQGAQPQGTENIEPAELTHIHREERREGDTNIDARTDIRREGDNVLYDSSVRREESSINLQQLNIVQGAQPQETENVEPVELTHISTEERREGDTSVVNNEYISRGEERLYNTEIRQDISNTGGDIIRQQTSAMTTRFSTGDNVEFTHISREGDLISKDVDISNTQQLTENLYQTYQQNIARNRRYMQNLKNIIESNKQPSSAETPAERTQRAAALALEHPERVIEEYRESESRESDRLEIIRRESERLLHPLQQRAHQLIREYLSAPERFYMSDRISSDNLTLLVNDIYHAAREDGRRQAQQETASEMTLAGERGRQAVELNQAPSSDTTVDFSGYPESTSYSPDVEKQRIYENLTLHNIYPVYNITADAQREGVSVEKIAGEVRERAEAIREAAEGEERSREIVENIYRRENSSEKEFTTMMIQRDSSQSREVISRLKSETVNRLLENVVNRWAKRQIENAIPQSSYEEETLSFVHKSTENTVDEETIENLRQEMLKMEQTQRSVNERIENRYSENVTQVNNINERTVERNSEEIQNVINKSVRAQLDAITERVYTRIERQLKSEQRRRGL